MPATKSFVTRNPAWMFHCIYRVSLGWSVFGVGWDKLPDGKYRVRYEIGKLNRYAVYLDGWHWMHKFAVYEKMTWRQAIRFWWTVLRSKDVADGEV